MKNIVFFIIAALLPPALMSQQFDRSVVWGGTQDDNASRVIQDASGDLYVLGTYSGNAQFPLGTLQGFGFQDVYLMKVSTDGTPVWQIGIGGSGNDLASAMTFDSDGNVLIAGRFQGSMDLDPGNGESLVTSSPSGSIDGFLARYSSSTGALIEAYDISSGGTIDIRSMQLAENGSVFIAGQFNQTVDFDFGPGSNQVSSAINSGDAFVGKYSAALNLEWLNPIGSFTPAIDYFSDVELSPDGGVYVTGLLGGTVDIDPGVGQTTLNAAIDACLIRYNQLDGSLDWGFLLGGSSVDVGVTLMLTEDLDILVSGSMNSQSFDADPGPGVQTISKAGSAAVPFILRYSPTATYINGFAFGDGGATSISVNRMIPSYGGTILVLGNFAGSVDIDSGAETELLTSQAAGGDAFMVQYESNWQPNRFIHFTGEGTENLNDGIISGIYLYAVGQFDDVCFPDAGDTTSVSPVSGGMDAGLFVWNTNPEVLINEAIQESELLVYPNPSRGILFLQGLQPEDRIMLTDHNGKECVALRNGEQLDLSMIEPGLYVVRVIKSDGRMQARRFLLQGR